jgi:hypothetical protein
MAVGFALIDCAALAQGHSDNHATVVQQICR